MDMLEYIVGYTPGFSRLGTLINKPDNLSPDLLELHLLYSMFLTSSNYDLSYDKDYDKDRLFPSTPGVRTLQAWFEHSRNVDEIRARQDAVKELETDEDLFQCVSDYLTGLNEISLEHASTYRRSPVFAEPAVFYKYFRKFLRNMVDDVPDRKTANSEYLDDILGRIGSFGKRDDFRILEKDEFFMDMKTKDIVEPGDFKSFHLYKHFSHNWMDKCVDNDVSKAYVKYYSFLLRPLNIIMTVLGLMSALYMAGIFKSISDDNSFSDVWNYHMPVLKWIPSAITGWYVANIPEKIRKKDYAVMDAMVDSFLKDSVRYPKPDGEKDMSFHNSMQALGELDALMRLTTHNKRVKDMLGDESCYPEIDDREHVYFEVENARSPLLLYNKYSLTDKKSENPKDHVVPFSLKFEAPELLHLSAPNSSAKTTTIKTIAGVQNLAYLGARVPCSYARVSVSPILTYASTHDSQLFSEGALGHDLDDINRKINYMDKNTIIIINEMPTASNTDQLRPINYALLRTMHDKGGVIIMADHDPELADMLKSAGIGKFVTFDYDIDKRTSTFEMKEDKICRDSRPIDVVMRIGGEGDNSLHKKIEKYLPNELKS